MKHRATTVIFWVMGALACSAGLPAFWTLGQETETHVADVAKASVVVHAKELSRAFRSAAERTRGSVATIIVKTKPSIEPSLLREMLRDPGLRLLLPDELNLEDFKDGDGTPSIPGFNVHVGSGVIVDASGILLTNHHVVEDAEEITVRLPDGTEYRAGAPVSDPMSDLAILRIDAPQPLPVAEFGDSDQMNIGDWVIAIGSPFELEATVSAGIISAKGRGIEQIKRGRLLQTDAAINPGNSGGPLVNLDGEVIGINTAIATSNGGYQGIGFAIPANRAVWIWRELAEHGKVRRAYMGIEIAELDAADAARFHTRPRAGVWVRRVAPDGAAAKAGIATDDLITDFAGVPVRMPRDLQDIVEQSPIGSTQAVKVLRDGQPLELSVTLDNYDR